MLVDTDNVVSITETNRNFSKVARMVDENGPVIIFKNNAPAYVLTRFEQLDEDEAADPTRVKALSDALIKKNRRLYEELAK